MEIDSFSQFPLVNTSLRPLNRSQLTSSTSEEVPPFLQGQAPQASPRIHPNVISPEEVEASNHPSVAKDPTSEPDNGRDDLVQESLEHGQGKPEQISVTADIKVCALLTDNLSDFKTPKVSTLEFLTTEIQVSHTGRRAKQ